MLKKKKAMSGDRSPWWRSSSQSSAISEVKGETKQNKWGDISRQFYYLGLLVRDKSETWHKSMEETKKEVGRVSVTDGGAQERPHEERGEEGTSGAKLRFVDPKM